MSIIISLNESMVNRSSLPLDALIHRELMLLKSADSEIDVPNF